MLGVHDLDVVAGLDHAGGDLAGPVGAQVQALRALAVHPQASALMLRTMSVTSSRTPGIDENSCSTPSIWIDGDGRALQRGQQHAAQRVAERQAEAALERLGDDGRGRDRDRRRARSRASSA